MTSKKCRWCKNAALEGVFCANCAAKNRVRCAERYRDLKAHGLCVYCKYQLTAHRVRRGFVSCRACTKSRWNAERLREQLRKEAA